jgi:hypothetical protein
VEVQYNPAGVGVADDIIIGLVLLKGSNAEPGPPVELNVKCGPKGESSSMRLATRYNCTQSSVGCPSAAANAGSMSVKYSQRFCLYYNALVNGMYSPSDCYAQLNALLSPLPSESPSNTASPSVEASVSPSSSISATATISVEASPSTSQTAAASPTITSTSTATRTTDPSASPWPSVSATITPNPTPPRKVIKRIGTTMSLPLHFSGASFNALKTESEAFSDALSSDLSRILSFLRIGPADVAIESMWTACPRK